MRLVHFSDIHIARCPRDWHALFDKRILGLTNYVVRRRSQLHETYVTDAVENIQLLTPDLVVCSGDITCIGSPEEFADAVAVLRPLVANPHFDFLFIPGNHDAYVRDRRSRCALHEAFSVLNRGRWALDELPVTMTYDRTQVCMVNEALPTSIVFSSGRLRPEDGRAIQHWAADERRPGETRILLGHFPTQDPEGNPLSRRRRLNGVNLVADALARGCIDISLCGHIHDPFTARHGKRGLEVCAGSLTMTGTVNVLDIDRESNHVTQQWVSVLTPSEQACPKASCDVRETRETIE